MHYIMKKNIITIALALSTALGASAQGDIVARFDMTLDDGNAITESVSDRRFAVNGNLVPRISTAP